MVGRVVAHVLYPEEFKASQVRPKEVILSQAEDGDLSKFCSSLQVPKLAELLEVPDQVNKTILRK